METIMSSVPKIQTFIPVWDLFVRVFHWSLVLGVAVSLWTGFLAGAGSIDLHVWVGTGIAALVYLRLVWGVLGSGFARFSQFLTSPRHALHHLGALRAGTAPRHVGHNPLGGWMILALLGIVILLTVTGVAVLGGVFHAGPFKALANVDTGLTILPLHELAAFALLTLIGLHVAGTIFEGRRNRENLVAAMVSGRKERRDAALPITCIAPRYNLFVYVGAVGLMAIAALLLSLSRQPVPDAPVALAGSSYAKNCTDCHMAYHPSLLPGASWSIIMADLSDHFGEDASLKPALVREISDWLTAHAAETTDSKPARVFAATSPDKPLEITATPFWIRTHEYLPKALLVSAPVFSKGNCAACHTDAAQGWFYPGDIDVPKPQAPPAAITGDTNG